MRTRRRHLTERTTQAAPDRALRRRAPALVLAGAAALVLFLGLAWLLSRHGHGAAQPGGLDQSLVVEPRPFASTIAVAGVVAASDSIDVTAPLDGVVKRIGFEYGAPVRKGQVLVEFDTASPRQHRNEAEAAYLKANQAEADMADWTNGPEVSRARRAQATAAMDLQDTQRKEQETKALLDRGLVPRSEYDSLVKQERSQTMALTAADQDLAVTLRHGQGANRQVTAIELDNARAQLAELDTQLGGAVVRAPADGVIVRPPSDKGESAGPLHAGLSMSRGQLIGAIARAGGLGVRFKLGEADADRVSPGQAVSVTGPGFAGLTLKGHVTSVGGEALPGSAGGGSTATFAAAAQIDDLSPAQLAVVRIGMTANVVIAVYAAPAALVVPPDAVRGAAPDATVMVKDAKTGRPRPVAVRIGHTAPDGVEVLSGLRPGDIVVWATPVSADAQPPGS
jgi:multidrug efflux pump subunit AcrA (membrane-fusion protein)